VDVVGMEIWREGAMIVCLEGYRVKTKEGDEVG
jgi:hypothetical protein